MAWLLDENKLDGTTLALVVGLIGGGFAATFFLSQRALKRTIAELRQELDGRVSALEAKMQAASVAPAPVQPVVHPAASVISPRVKPAAPPREEVTPEMLLVLAAAVTAFMGKKVRIRSAKMLYAHESFNAWSQQGRVVVQASHNLAQGY
jgi:methylmalonyl-CoA carboxyltransferase large subunit